MTTAQVCASDNRLPDPSWWKAGTVCGSAGLSEYGAGRPSHATAWSGESST